MQFKYLSKRVEGFLGAEIERALNQYGEYGWEVVYMRQIPHDDEDPVPTFEVIFKRGVKDEEWIGGTR